LRTSQCKKRSDNVSSEEQRDKEIFEVIAKAYDFEWEQKERIDSKLNNLISIAMTVATLNMGVGFFVLERVTIRNPYFNLLVGTLFASVGLFVSGVIISLYGYGPRPYTATPKDSMRLVEECMGLQKIEVIHKVAATMAKSTDQNRQTNLRKTKIMKYAYIVLILGVLAIMIFTVFMVLALSVPPTIDA